MMESEQPSRASGPKALGSQRERFRLLFKNTGIYTFGEILVALVGVVQMPIVTQFLAPAEFGIWSLATMVLAGFLIVCNPALDGSVRRFFYDHEHDEPRKRRLQGTIFSALMLWSFTMCVITTLVGPWLFDALFDGFPFWPYGALVVWMVFLTMLGVIPRAVWVAAERPASFMGAKLLGSAVDTLGSVGLVALAGVGVLGMFYGRAASLLVLAIPFVIYSVRHIKPAWSWDDLRSAMRFSLPLVPHLAAHWVLGMSDRVLIERHYARLEASGATEAEFGVAVGGLSLAAVGIYGLAYEFLKAVNLVSMSMNQAWVPQFTRAHDRPEERAFVARSITYFILAVASMSTAVIVLGPPLARLVWSEAEYAYVAELIPILGFGGLFQGLYYVFVAVLFYYKENRLIPVITVASAIVNVVLNLLWLPDYGLAGACWATVVGYTVLMLGVWWAARRHPMPDFESGRLVRIAAVLSSVVIGGLLLDGRLSPIAETLGKLALLGVGAGALWLLGVFAPREARRS